MTTMEMNVKLSKLNDSISQSNERMRRELGPDFRLEKNCSSLEGKKKVSLCVTS